jgi:hypothetical protein
MIMKKRENEKEKMERKKEKKREGINKEQEE